MSYQFLMNLVKEEDDDDYDLEKEVIKYMKEKRENLFDMNLVNEEDEDDYDLENEVIKYMKEKMSKK